MRDVEDLLLDQPPLGVRQRKAEWLQLRRLVSESLATAVESQPFGSLDVMLIGDDGSLARAAAADCAVTVSHTPTVSGLSPGRSEHVAIMLLPRAPATERVQLLRAAHQCVRPAGLLVVLATVVVAPRENRSLVPSMRQLVEELYEASGLALHIDELRSVRWHGEPYVRGVVVSATSLSSGDPT